MKQKFIFSVCVAVALSLPLTSFAQESSEPPTQEGAVVADVNLSNATIVRNDGKTLVVSFDIENRAAQTQPDIRYGIEIVRTTEKGQETVDAFIATETVSVPGNQSAHKEISYPIPSTLSGDFDVWIIAKTTGGLMLGLNNAGKATFSPSGDRVSIVPDSCHLKVSGDDETYALSQGVDVSKDESLSLVCTLRDESPETLVPMPSLSLAPYFDTYRRSVYGEPVSMGYPTPEAISLARHETKTVSIDIPTASEPQAYDVSVIFKKVDGAPVSEKVVVHYVLRGASATIQNVSLDRESYTKGDMVNATMFITPSADGFPESRAGQGTAVSLSATLSVTDAKGAACIDPQTKTLEGDASQMIFSAPALIGCDSPFATVAVSDADGNILDSRGFGNMPSVPRGVPVSEGMPFFSMRILTIALVSLLFVVSLGLILWKRFGKKGISGLSKILILGFVLSGSLLVGVGEAEAVSWNASKRYYCAICDDVRNRGLAVFLNCLNSGSCAYGSWDWDGTVWVGGGWKFHSNESAVSFVANTNKTTYVSGENIIISGSAVWTLCGNSHSTSLKAYSDFGSVTVFDQVAHRVNGSASLVAPAVSSSTTYTIRLLGDTVESYEPGTDDGNRWTGTSTLTITVIPARADASCGSANGVAVSSAPTTNLCSSGTASFVTGTGPWSWTCTGSNGGTDVSCSAPKSQTLKVCANDCASSVRYDTLSSFSNVPVTLFACLGTGECNGDDTPVSGDWTAGDTPANSVDISMTSGISTYVTKNPALSGIASEDITVTYDGKSATAQALLNGCVPAFCAADERAEYCSGELFTIDNGCGGTTECEGTRNCDFNWREVAPGE